MVSIPNDYKRRLCSNSDVHFLSVNILISSILLRVSASHGLFERARVLCENFCYVKINSEQPQPESSFMFHFSLFSFALMLFLLLDIVFLPIQYLIRLIGHLIMLSGLGLGLGFPTSPRLVGLDSAEVSTKYLTLQYLHFFLFHTNHSSISIFLPLTQ